jgi:hypothetical protein
MWVRAAFVRGVRSFSELVRSLPGVYPADAFLAVSRLRHELPTGWQLDGVASLRAAPDDWPVEHALDFDWRFTPETARLLADRCRSQANGAVAFLGAPSLAREAATRGWHTGISLFDRNPHLIAAAQRSVPEITALCGDLLWGDPVRVGEAAAAVADPPWYPEHISAFLWAASRLTRIGGQILLSLPAEGTRPNILSERDAIFADAVSFGLRLACLEPGALAYWTPPFERNALTAAGIPAVPNDWRRGDLAKFVVTHKTLGPRPVPCGPREEWDEECIGIVRIKCKKSAEGDFQDPTLSPAVPGDILPSVSRRDPSRRVADVWTSGNRLYRCEGTGVFRIILSALSRGANVEGALAEAVGRKLTFDEANLVHRATRQAVALIWRENQELAKYGKGRHEGDVGGAV